MHISDEDEAIGKVARKNFRKSGKTRVWASMKLKGFFEKVESEDTGRLTIAQDILREGTDFPRRIRSGRCRTCVLIVTAFRLRTKLGGSPQGMATATTGRRSSATGGVRLVVASTIGGLQTGYWSYKTVSSRSESLSSTCRTAGNLRQLDQLLDSPVESKVTGFGIDPPDSAEPCFPHDNIVGNRSRDECMRSNELNVGRKLLSIL